jgi:hypothetical protein
MSPGMNKTGLIQHAIGVRMRCRQQLFRTREFDVEISKTIHIAIRAAISTDLKCACN